MKSRQAFIAFFTFILLGLGIFFFEHPFSSPPILKNQLFESFDVSSVSSIELSYRKQGIKLFMEGKKWRVTTLSDKNESQPSPSLNETVEANLSFPADPEPVERMLQAVQGLRSGGVVSSNPDKYPVFHVDDSGIEVTLKGAGTPLTFVLGKEGSGGNTYLRKIANPDDPKVYLIPEEVRSIFLKSLYDLREKKVIDLDVSTLEEIKLKRGNEILTLRRDPIKKWIWAEKDSSPLDIETIESLARNLSHVKALTLEGTVPLHEAGLDPPDVVASLKFSGGPVELQLKLGKLKGADTYFAALSGSKAWESEVFTVPQAMEEKLKLPSDQFLMHPEP
jgi:hypothetical protein